MEKFCVICGKKIENPRSNSVTCGDPECGRKRRIATTRAKQIEKEKNEPGYIQMRNERSNRTYHNRVNRLNSLERQLLGYKLNELANKLKDTYFAGGCGGENLDKLLDAMKSVALDPYSIDDTIAGLDDVELV